MTRLRQIAFAPVRTQLLWVALATHALALFTYGAVFWVDSIDYVHLAESLAREGALRAHYDGPGTWFFSHLQPGVPLVWLASGVMPEGWRWPAIAVFQHAVAAGAAVLCFATLQRYWPSRIHIVSFAILMLLPFHQAAHNNLMTESLTASLVLVMFAMSLRILKEPRLHGRHLVTALAALFIAAQFRSYYALLGVAMLLAVLAGRRMLLSWQSAACVAVAGLALVAFPAYRYVETGMLILPRPGINALTAARWANPEPSDRARVAIAQVPFLDAEQRERVLDPAGLNYDTTLRLAEQWHAAGASDLEIHRRAGVLADILRDDGARVIRHRLLMALASSGAILQYLAFPGKELVFPRMTAWDMLRHQWNVWRQHGWVDRSDHGRVFEIYFHQPRPGDGYGLQSLAQRLIAESWEPYLSTLPVVLRDPFFLGIWPPDFVFYPALAAMVLLWRQERYLCLAVLGPMALNFWIAFDFPVGNTRYAYSLVPLYFALVSVLLASRRRGRATRAAVARTTAQEMKP